MERKRVGVIGFDGAMALDLVGPLEAFDSARVEVPGKGLTKAYEVVIIGFTGKSFVSSSGITFKPHTSLQGAFPLDTLIIPGGTSLRLEPHVDIRLGAWIKANAHRVRRISSVCTGAFALAASGLLDGKQVATHWKYAADLAKKYPKVKVDPNAIYLRDGKFYTSAGVTAGIDLSLALIEEDFGPEAALDVARFLVVYLKRSGGQQQYSNPLRLQTGTIDRFPALASWIVANLKGDLSVDALAAQMSMSRRNFTRSFRKAFTISSADYVETLRLDEARTLLSSSTAGVEEVASAVGFKSADVFRRASSRKFGVSPSRYREPFSMTTTCGVGQERKAQDC